MQAPPAPPTPPPGTLSSPRFRLAENMRLRLVERFINPEERDRKKEINDLRAEVGKLQAKVEELEATIVRQKMLHQGAVEKFENKMEALTEEKAKVKMLLREAYVNSIAI